MPITIEQRLRALERKAEIQTDTIKIMHALIKGLRKEFTDFILNGLKKPKNGG